MSSYTVTLNSNSSILHTTLFPAIHLSKDKEWEAALLDFTTYNSIPNITEGKNNKFYYYKSKNSNGTVDKPEIVSLSTGAYEITDINNVLQKKLGETNISLEANNSLLKAELKSKYYVDFSQQDSIGSVLGFPSSTKLLEPNKTHVGSDTVNIIQVNAINITCNIVQGAYSDGVNKHILHSFYPTVEPGFKIVEKPHNLVYLPLSTSHISDIVLNVLDQDGNLVDFRGELITVRIHIKSSFQGI